LVALVALVALIALVALVALIALIALTALQQPLHEAFEAPALALCLCILIREVTQ
jgi:hypothetical protein